MHGLENGFSIIDDDTIIDSIQLVETANHKSVRDPEAIDRVNKQILKELEDDNYAIVKDKPRIVSALGAIPKRDGSVRLIHDCSLPETGGLNYYASKDTCVYHTISEALDMIKPGWYMAKVDLQSAYRAVGISPKEYCLTGLKWHLPNSQNPSYLVDRTLPFGARKSAAIFNRITKSVCRMLKRRGHQACLVVLDDFFVAAETEQRCMEALNCLIQLLRSLGFRINWNKVVGPSQGIVFLGIYIDTVANILSLDPTKINELLELLNHYMASTRLSRKQLESLTGKLSWASNVVVWGRTQLCSFYRALSSLKHAAHKVRISSLKPDLEWWCSVLACGQNSRHIWDMRPALCLLTDSCQTGGGAFCEGNWLYRNWRLDTRLSASHINVKELAIIRETLVAWGQSLSGHKVQVRTDNTSTMAFINKGTSKNQQIIAIIKDIAFMCSTLDIGLEATYIPGINNCMADAISRLHEPGQIARMVALLNQWHMYSGPSGYWLPAHMSLKALYFLLPQVSRWQSLLKNWTRRWHGGDS